MSALARVSQEDLALVEKNTLETKQLAFLLQETPKKYVKERPGKGGGKWKFVSGVYVRKVLNLMFGWNWDFEVLSEQVLHGEVIVKGRLTVRTNGQTVVKSQFGNKEVINKRNTETPLSIGNDFKAAATDALKKCAFELGIASDVYAPDEFNALEVQETTLEDLQDLWDHVAHKLDSEPRKNILRIIDNEEKSSYNKAWNILKKY